jgi:hypothetical protein
MKLPQFHRAVVARRKIVGYLLSATHPDGQSKAQWFARFGFTVAGWRVLSQALKRHAGEQEFENLEETPLGTRYTIVGPLKSPVKRDPRVRSVWFVESGRTIPKLVTAYPVRRKRS